MLNFVKELEWFSFYFIKKVILVKNIFNFCFFKCVVKEVKNVVISLVRYNDEV